MTCQLPADERTNSQKRMPELAVSLGRLQLKNPVLVASGTFGYAREMEGVLPLQELGAILPKTITQNPRPGNAPWRSGV